MIDEIRSIHVLLIEDDEDDVLIVTELLSESTRFDVTLTTVTTEQKASETVANTSFDAILVDYRLGPDSGIDWVKACRARGIKTPIIMLTGQGAEGTDQKAMAAGADDYLLKGDFDAETLQRSIFHAVERCRAQELLHQSEARYRHLFEVLVEHSRTAKLIFGQQAGFYFSNPAGKALLGENDALLEERLDVFRDLPDGLSEVQLTLDGEARHLEAEISATCWQGQQARLLTLRDLSEREDYEKRLRLLQRSMDAAQNGIIITDCRVTDDPIIYVNPAFSRITGYHPDEVLGKNCRFLQLEENDQPEVHALREAIAAKREINVTVRNFRKDGTAFWNDLYISPVFDESGEATHCIGIQNDISAQRFAEQELAYNANHDALTGLPNLSLLKDRLTQSFGLALRHTRHVAVLAFNLDGFKGINSSYGLAQGDVLLTEAAKRAAKLGQPSDTVARISADEFMILRPDVVQEQEIVTLAETLLQDLAAPFVLNDELIYLTASVGIAMSGTTTENPDDLIRHASLALRDAKRLGGDTYYWYSESMNTEVSRRVRMRNDIQTAMEHQAFTLHYQVIVASQSGKVVGMEALIRWHHPEEGLLSPAEFLPIAESTGQIVALGDWVLHQACLDNQSRIRRGGAPFKVSVNVSSVQFQRGDPLQSVRSALRASGMAAELLELEVVESVLLEDSDKVRDTLQQIRALGVGVVIDDFGTGFSSLEYLKKLPVTKIKIDRSFIRDLVTDSVDAAIVQGVIGMAHKLRLEIVAEGVEDASQASLLIRSQCDLLQGFFFSRPIPLDQMHDFALPQEVTQLFERQNTSNNDKGTLLILDDENNILHSLKRLLRRDGYTILTTNQPNEAFRMLADQPVHVILSDQRMPEMNGTEFLSQVKEMYPETIRIVLSGYTDLDSVTDAINRGSIYKFLTKPWDDDQLRSEIRQAFLHYNANRQAKL